MKTLGKVMLIILPVLLFIGLVRLTLGQLNMLPNGSSLVAAFSGCPNLIQEYKDLSMSLEYVGANVVSNLASGDLFGAIGTFFGYIGNVVKFLMIPIRVVVWIFRNLGGLLTL